MPQLVTKALVPVGLVFGILLCIASYYPGMHGGFIFDDWPNIVENPQLHVESFHLEGLRQAALSSDAGVLKRPVSMLSFWLNYLATGLDPFYFKLTNLVIHLLNGLGLFWLTRLLLEESKLSESASNRFVRLQAIPLMAAAIWLIHPLNLTAVLYVVQRMTSLAATFVILGLICYLHGRRRLSRGESGYQLMLFGTVAFGLLGALTKESAALLPLYIAVIELTLLRTSNLAPANAKRMKLLFVSVAILPVAAGLLFLATHWDWLVSGYVTRDFTLSERLLTEARVLWLYLRWTIIPTPNDLGLFHDDILVSHDIFHPISTLFALGGLVIVASAAIVWRKKAPLFAFATLWFLASHALESSVIPLELVHEHRNYLAIFAPLLAGSFLLISAASRISRVGWAIPIAFVLALASVTFGRAFDWSSLDTLRMALVRHHPDSARSNYEAGLALAAFLPQNPLTAPQNYEKAKTYFERSVSLDDTAVNGLFSLIFLNSRFHGSVDAQNTALLEKRLSMIPLGFPVVDAFKSLVDWLTNGDVDLPKDEVVGLFEAALGNSSASRQTRAGLLSVLSSYYHNVAKDEQEAVSLAFAAIQEEPNEAGHHLYLAHLAETLGNYKLAETELEATKRGDSLGRYSTLTNELEVRISSTDQASKPAEEK